MMGTSRAPFVRALLLVACACHAPPAQREPAASPSRAREWPELLVDVAPGDLCATSGAVAARHEGGFHVASGAMRAVAAGSTGGAAELSFVYRGAAPDVVLLASGELRRQIGLKLRAQDTCNVVYVMWEIAPRPHVVVSMKRNPGRSSHSECGPTGYLALKPRAHAPAPPILKTGERHTLRAEIGAGSLRVEADGDVVWEGELPPAVLDFDGPAGIRSDNGVFDFELRVARAVRAMAPSVGCAR